MYQWKATYDSMLRFKSIVNQRKDVWETGQIWFKADKTVLQTFSEHIFIRLVLKHSKIVQ